MLSRIQSYAISTVKSYRYLSLYRTSSRFCSDNANSEPNPEEVIIKELKDENQRLSEVVKEIEDKYKRSLAESENVRQRMLRQVDEAKQFGIQKFCKDLLDVADILTKATESINEKELQNDTLRDMYKGLKMTESQMLKVLARHGVEKIEPEVGEKFDPNIHEALFKVPIPSVDKTDLCGTVGTLTKVGYRLHQKTLRPASVGVFQ